MTDSRSFVGLYTIARPGCPSARAVEAVNLTERVIAAGADVLPLGEGRHSLEDVYLEIVDEDVEATSR